MQRVLTQRFQLELACPYGIQQGCLTHVGVMCPFQPLQLAEAAVA